MRLMADGDKINYPEDVGTPTVDMTLVKTFFNSAISTKGARCVMLDVKDFYLNTPMARYEYMRLKLTAIPEEIIIKYNYGRLRRKTDTCTVKSGKECIDYPKQG
jgi:hypothetical protein